MYPRNAKAWRGRLLSLLGLLFLCLPGCSRELPTTNQSITISIAASTKELVEDLASEFQKTHAVKIQINPGPTSGLAKQIVAGAPVDLFLSASRPWADAVIEAHPTSTTHPLLTNSLVLIVPEQNPGEIQTPQDLLSDRVKYVALAGESVPAGTYADQALTKLGLLAPLQQQERIVRGQDVRSTLSYVERSEAEAGIVYATDVAIATHVKQVYAFPRDLHDEIVYVLVLLPHANGNAVARAFYEFLLSAEAAPIYQRHHFQRLGEPWMLSPGDEEAIRLTLVVALTAVAISLPLAIATAWLLAKRQFPGKTLLEVMVNLPLVLPPVVTGYVLLVVFGRTGPVGAWLEHWFHLRLVFDWKGAAVASAVVGFPLLVRPIRQALAAVDDRMVQVARTLGASSFTAFRRITLPMARPGIISGCLLAFARSMGEFGATIMIAGNIPGQTRTVTLAIYTLLDGPQGSRHAIGLVLVSIAISATALFCGEWLERRSSVQ